MALDSPSYHDVVVQVDGDTYRIKDHYDLELTCSRVRGWTLWRHHRDTMQLVGGEYESDYFKVTVSDMVICEYAPAGASGIGRG